MAKKKANSRRTTSGDAKKAPAPAETPKAAAKKTVAKKSPRTSGSGGLFLPGNGEEQTDAEKSLASAVLAAGGTDKLLTILKHVEAAGGTSSALGALEVYERMRRVLNPSNQDTTSHPLFDSLESSDGENKSDD